MRRDFKTQLIFEKGVFGGSLGRWKNVQKRLYRVLGGQLVAIAAAHEMEVAMLVESMPLASYSHKALALLEIEKRGSQPTGGVNYIQLMQKAGLLTLPMGHRGREASSSAGNSFHR